MILQEMLFAKTVAPLAEKTLNAYSLRHKAIANNIANVEVPGYQRLEVHFEDALKAYLKPSKEALYKTHPKHLPDAREISAVPRLSIDRSNPKLNAINNVDIDLEMADLAKNQLSFNLIATALRHEYNRLRMAIRGQ